MESLTAPPATRRYLPWLLALFVGSGCAALIYEVIWLQLLQLVIGSSGISLGVLLGVFMGGMCLGSLALPRLIANTHHPLKVYAFLELGIGIFGVAILYGTPFLADLYEGSMGHGVVSRSIVAAICLLPPTVLMGATLPAISRWVKATPEGVSWMGFFYAGNIGGAVVGCLLTGFYLLREYDMATGTYVAVGIDVIVALLALAVAGKSAWRFEGGKAAEVAVARRGWKQGVYVVIGLSGLCGLGAEVVWTRLLSLLLGPTVYTFSIILAIFLLGLGIGSSGGAFLVRKARRPRVALGFCQLLVAGAAAMGALVLTRSIPYWPIDVAETTKHSGVWHAFLLDVLRAACVVLPAAILWGASFPLALASVASGQEDSGKMVGGVYAANTLGAIAGSLGFSVLVIPLIGTQWGQRLIILIAALSSLVAFAPFLASRGNDKNAPGTRGWNIPGKRVAGMVLSAAGIVLLAGFVCPMPWVAVAFGRQTSLLMRFCAPGMVAEKDVPLTNHPAGSIGRYCIYVGEGMSESVAVDKSVSGILYFHGSGKVQASTLPMDMRLQRMLGHLSVLAQRNPDAVEDVLVVACGAGVTAGSFVPYPSIKHITICDIEPLVPKVVTPMFGSANYHVVDGIDKENPHMVEGKEVRVVYDDGRHYVATLPKDKKFDVITCDPLDPWVKGIAALNTVEYFSMCREHLKPGGIVSVWVPLYESNTETVKSVMATFFQVFPNGMLFSNDTRGKGYDAILLGQIDPPRIDLDKLHDMLNSVKYAGVKESLKEVGFGADTSNIVWKPNKLGEVEISLMAAYAGRAPDMSGWMKGAQINTDRNLRLEYLAGMAANVRVASDILDGILQYNKFPEDMFSGSEDRLYIMKVGFLAARNTR